MKFGSVFTGIGGFDLGFERAGMTCAWQVEIDSDCNRVLQRQFPDAERHKDVSTLGRLANVDVLCGGFPCQDLSVAGKRKGLAGERSGLWFEFLRIIGLNRPRWIVIENVPGLLSSDEGRDFAVILRGLVECGYCLAWRIVDAQFYRVAQRRRRVFIVGSLGDGSSAEILFESESVSWNPPTRGEAGPGVTPILEAGARTNGDGQRDGDGIGVEGDPMFTLQRGKQHAVAATLDQRGRGPTDAVMMNLQVSMPLKAKANSSHDESHESYVVAEALRTKRPGEGGIAGDDTHIVAASLMGHSGLHDSGGQQTFVTHALRSEGADASEDGTGRGTPLVCAFEPYHDEHDGRGANFRPSETNPALRGPNGTDNTLIAFSSKDHGADAGEIAPTLRSQNFKDSHINGGGQVAIAFTERGRDGGANLETQDELSYALRDPQKGMNSRNAIAGQFGVRRLTPRECERLQGFPDDWTLYDANGKEISDSARYRVLGNAVCVNVAEWIGKRIMEIANK